MKHIYLAAALSLLAAPVSAQMGDPIPDIDVAIKAVPGGALIASGKTDSRGTFTFRKIEIGEYTLTVVDKGKPFVVTDPGNKLVIAHTIQSPRDAASGMATGRRQHGTITFVKEWGAANRTVSVASDSDWIKVTVTAKAAPMGRKPE